METTASAQSRIDLISKVNIAIHLGHDESYHRAIDCMKRLIIGRSEIAKKCLDFDMPDESRELYYQLLNAYNEDICKLLGL